MSRGRKITTAIVLAACNATRLSATTYYVSPTGSDLNAGTSAASPWGSVAKVDATSFQPGDKILFQYGSSWDASLNASSSGTVAAPIVYSAYGNPTLGNPTFYGSDPISSSAFTNVTGTTYQTTAATPVNWIFDNHQFTREAQDALTQSGSATPTNPASDLSFVESTPGSFYYNSGNGQLFVNTGSAISGQNITAATRQDAIFSNSMSNLVFKNLNVSETAADYGGYGVRIENSSNVSLLNSTVSSGGKHNIGVIDVVGFTGVNILANGSAPDQGFGGASAAVSYADADSAVATGTNNTSTWTNLTYVNANGPYTAFISHGSENGIANVTLNHVVSLGGYGTGIVIYNTGANERVLINNAVLSNNSIELDTDNSVINNVISTGASSTIALGGSHTVVQNSSFNGTVGDSNQNKPGAFEDGGTNNTLRFNVINLADIGPALTISNATSQTQMYGNIIQYSGGQIAYGLGYSGTGTLNSNYNLYSGPNFAVAVEPNGTYLNLAQWQALGYDLNSIQANAMFTDPTNGDFTLQNGSPAVGFYPGTLDSSLTVANSLLGSANANGAYNAGLNPAAWATMNSLTSGLLLNNSATNTISPANNTLTITSAGSLVSTSNSILNIVGNVNNSGLFSALGGLIQSGNFNNSASVTIGGSQLWSQSATFNNLSGTATFTSDAGGTVAPLESLLVNVSGGSVLFASTQHLLSLNIASGAIAQLTNSSAGRSILFTPSLTISGKLDLMGNDLVVESGSLSFVTSLIKQGYNGNGGGNWNGSGITSSTAAADTHHLTALGILLNTVDGINPLYGSGTTLGLFDGAAPAATDVLVRYTYYGDANLDGKIDGSDYSRIDSGYLQKLTGWFNGDFNYDGIVNGSDYTLMDNAFNSQGARLTSQVAVLPTDEIAAGISPTAVPEPVELGFLLAAVPLLLGRRRV